MAGLGGEEIRPNVMMESDRPGVTIPYMPKAVPVNLDKDEISDLRNLIDRLNECHLKKYQVDQELARAETAVENELNRLQFRREKK